MSKPYSNKKPKLSRKASKLGFRVLSGKRLLAILRLRKLIQTKIIKERARWARELNLKVQGLLPPSFPMYSM